MTHVSFWAFQGNYIIYDKVQVSSLIQNRLTEHYFF